MSTFSVDVSGFCAKYADRMNLVLRKVALDLFSRVILRTPVDTGRARGNWQTGVNTVNARLLKREDQSGQSAIAEVARKTKNAKAGDVLYLANSLPYIRALEYGHSKQAPSGMVRLTIREFNATVSKAAQEAKREVP